MLLQKMVERFEQKTPMAVAARVLMEAALHPQSLDDLFRRVAKTQYTRELLFSTCVNVMASVVCRTHRSINAAHQESPAAIGASLKALYEKFAGVETQTSEALVRHTAERLSPVIRAMHGENPPLLSSPHVQCCW